MAVRLAIIAFTGGYAYLASNTKSKPKESTEYMISFVAGKIGLKDCVAAKIVGVI
ncbi:unnamed protein product [Acidithrix sp. C25]|nr:unnamed protein product [Acidithrix sp. C25]